MTEHMIVSFNPWSNLLMILGLGVAIVFWTWRPERTIQSLPILMGALVGGFAGAKLSFVLAEVVFLWNSPALFPQLFYGKTILGGLLGGWAGVELAKYFTGQRQQFGDEFARVIPVGIALGRLSCLVHGCCLGRPIQELPNWLHSALALTGWERWPAPLGEMVFQVGFFGVSMAVRRVEWLRGQHFHLYLISYGLFRLGHEFLRDTPRYFGLVSPYMILAVLCTLSGSVAFVYRYTQRLSTDNDRSKSSVA